MDAALTALQAQVNALGGGGLTEGEVDDRVETLVEDFAENSSTQRVPASKLPSSTAGNAGIAAGVSNNEIDSESGTTRLTWSVTHVLRLIHRIVPTWARTGNTDTDPDQQTPGVHDGRARPSDAVDARVRAGVLDFAETGNTDDVPAAKLPGATAGDVGAVQAVTQQIVDTEAGTAVLGWSVNLVKRLVYAIIPSWAHTGNTDQIPANKLPATTGGGFTLHSGPTQPLDAIGADNDWYIQTTNGQFWQKVGGTWMLRYTDQLGMAGAGITETQARGLIADWAETGNTDVVPSNKLPTSTAANPGIAQGVTNAEIDTEAGNTRLTWSVTHVKRLVDRLTSFGAGVSHGHQRHGQRGRGPGLRPSRPRPQPAHGQHHHVRPHRRDVRRERPQRDRGVAGAGAVLHQLQRLLQFSGGASVGQVYATSQYRKLITKVEVLLNPLVGADAYLVRLVDTNADNSIKAKLFTSQTRSAPFGLGTAARAFNFHDADGGVGVPVDGGIRLGVLISRLGDNSDSAVAAIHGTEAGNSPRESYDDASVDFELVNDVVYQHIDPAVGASTHSHGTDIRGNIKIFYTLIVDHGDLVSGLTADEVDDRIEAGVEDWAEDGNTDEIPPDKLPAPTGTARGAPRGSTTTDANDDSGTGRLAWSVNHLRVWVFRLFEGWAAVGNTTLIPDAKIAGTIARDAEVTAAIAAHRAITDAHHVPGHGRRHLRHLRAPRCRGAGHRQRGAAGLLRPRPVPA